MTLILALVALAGDWAQLNQSALARKIAQACIDHAGRRVQLGRKQHASTLRRALPGGNILERFDAHRLLIFPWPAPAYTRRAKFW